ncbi:MAG: methylated-DNA--[protein]-cysteine S-methyltransferase [Planctomycetota bacterium]
MDGDYARIERVINYLTEHRIAQPSLDDLSGVAGLSRHHFHRVFSRWAAITPKTFLKCLTLEHARERLLAGTSVLDTALDEGLSGPSRLHDLFVTLDAASPGEVKSGGSDWNLRAGLAESPFGTCLIAEGPRGVCHLSFPGEVDRESAEETLRSEWPNADLAWDSTAANRIAEAAFGDSQSSSRADRPLKCIVRGSHFQVRVWRALLQIPEGSLATYGSVAQAIGQPQAARAVGSAIASNPIGFLIPCHRVIRASGAVGEYRWGSTRKRAMLAWESRL